MTKTDFERFSAAFSYDPETGIIVRHGRWAGASTTARTAHGYIQICFEGRKYYAHRVAWLLHTGAWPENEVDHINRAKDDNRWENLRSATRSENMANRPAQTNNKVGLKGVSLHAKSGRWRAQIRKDGKVRGLGYFDAPEDAHAAYVAAANDNFGAFARTG
ncbi:HNH endonuclease [Mesorhizobium sp. BR-1-1-8]|uniref:HNH endonuclease signature motif containing protein n=1 Tax=Mesorhizobium sp. BR-1-1-8 TaxID=2876659 RepID=UPI001CCD6837|nr:HNH endonuclease signature motif containing protein [Mesorhizobium sp. BR-1-1-8]MBZ9984895.1 HNH endonuclease [Mesorhizobium sp. BR-1-1-8]